MAQVSHTPGVPSNLPSVAYSSASPILVGPTALTGQPTITTLAQFSTGTTNISTQALAASAKVVSPFKYSTPIILGPAVFSGAPFNVGIS